MASISRPHPNPLRALTRAVLLGCAAGLLGLVLPISHPAPAAADPRVRITTVVSGLTIPWDVTWVGDVMLYDLRAGQVWSKRGSAAPRRVNIPLPRVYVNSEGGLLGMVADPAAATNGRFYLCVSTKDAAGRPVDVRVLRYRLTSDTTAVSDGSQPVVDGIPVNRGRHNGCRLRFGVDGKLYVGTGDAAVGTTPQRRSSLGGKVLRVNADGSIPRDNPYYSSGGDARYVWNYGHRNIQGLTARPGTKQMWTAEHGPARDDEINESVRAANYGWDPGPRYDESRPMTDKRKFPRAKGAKWSSGRPTVATSGLTFLSGSAWGSWEGAMAVAMLKGQGIKLLFLNPSRQVSQTKNIGGLGAYGRIRTVQQGPDGALYFTTSNGGGRDVIGRIAPTAAPSTVDAGRNVASTGVSAARVGSDLYVYARTAGNRIVFKRSTDDGRRWSGWQEAGVTSAAAPSVASSARGRVDLVTRSASGRVIYTWYVDRQRRGQTDLGGSVTAVSVSSASAGRLDVFALSPTGGVIRRQFDGQRWSNWRDLGGSFSSAVGVSVNTSTRETLLTARGPAGEVYTRTVTPTGDGTAWTRGPGQLWSGRALGDTRTGVGLVGASVGNDGYLTLMRGNLVQGIPAARFTSDLDVVTRPDGSWIVFGRHPDGSLSYLNGRRGEYRQVRLGGSLT